MEKLKLDLDGLSVESFRPDDAKGIVRGTVRGAESSDIYGCLPSVDRYCRPPVSQWC